MKIKELPFIKIDEMVITISKENMNTFPMSYTLSVDMLYEDIDCDFFNDLYKVLGDRTMSESEIVSELWDSTFPKSLVRLLITKIFRHSKYNANRKGITETFVNGDYVYAKTK